MIPDIIQETNQGISRIPLQDALFQRREVFMVGEINKESSLALIMQLRWLQADAPGAEITVYIDSPGGEVSSGLAIYDVMQGVRCPIRTVCIGSAYSMAAVLLAAGNQRDIMPHARIMIHDPLITGGVGGSALRVDSLAQDLMRTRAVVAEILAKHTRHSVDEIYAKTASDTFFNAQEAVDFGLADRIIQTLWESEQL